jgi:sn-glycerol 3-phosphate transport system ATP-binding protein
MKILDIAPSGDGWAIDGLAQALPNRLPQGQYQLGIRPEHIHFSDSGYPALVESTEYFGADTITACRIGGQRVLVRTPGRAPCAAGEAVFLSWPESAQHFFEKRSGLRCEGLEGAKAPS